MSECFVTPQRSATQATDSGPIGETPVLIPEESVARGSEAHERCQHDAQRVATPALQRRHAASRAAGSTLMRR